MAFVTWFEVAQVAPELDGTALGLLAQEMILNVVNKTLNVTDWGGETSDTLRLARCYLAAHMATMQKRRGAGGQVTSQSMGGIAQSYAAPMIPNGTGLLLTGYGQLYLGLARTRAFRAGFTTTRKGTNWPGGGWGV